MELSKNGFTITAPDALVADLVLRELTGTITTLPRQPTALPAIGSDWPGQGGKFAGILRDTNGGPDYALILGPQLAEAKHADVLAAAAAVHIDGHKDYRCPTRREQRLLFINLKDQFKEAWYWSSERHADDDACAWAQYFDYGDQGDCNVNDTCLGCAVRGIPL